MKLTFKRLTYKNITSVGAKPIEIDLANFRKILITGKNGAGKSTMLEALCFALFGKPFRNIKKGQLVNCVNKKAMLIELWFSDGKNDYHIKRGIKPNVFDITRNGEEIKEAASVKDFQTFFETDIIKMNMASFKQTIILGTAGYVPFMQLTAANRRVLIEDLINLSIYSKMDKLNKEVVKEIKQQMDALEIKLTGLRNEHDAHMTHINKQKQMSEGFVAQLKEAHKKHVDEAMVLQKEILKLTQELSEIVVGEDFTAKLNACSSAMTQINTRIDSVQRNIDFFSANDSCPTCKQAISKSHSDVVVHGLSNDKTLMKEKLDIAKGKSDNFTITQRAFIEAANEVRKIQSEVHNRKFMLTNEIARAKLAQKNIDDAQTEVEIDTTRVDELNVEIKEKREVKTDLFEEMYARKIVLGMLKDSGIKAVVMKRYIPVINKKINQYLKTLGADYTFTLDSEFNEIIKSRGREDFSYTSFSQGEKARIDLSLLFTWRDIATLVSGTEINLLILDEVFDSATDGEGVEAIHSILETLKGNIVVISHREEHDVNRFNKHVKMVKKGRFSVMNED
jgi:DNA repair exonuclease SbcCD ATPase subunit